MTPYYSEAGITIYHGDALDVVPQLQLVDAVVTDPPFFMPVQHYAGRRKWLKSWGDTSILAHWWASVLDVTVPRLNPTATFVTFCDDESYPVFYPDLYRRFDLLHALVWDKGRFGMGSPWRHGYELILSARWSDSKWVGGAGLSDVLRVKPIPSARREHPVDKPTDLLSQLMRPITEPGDLVLDMFAGSGSTLLAARMLKLRAIGVEIEERSCEIAVSRLSQRGLPLEIGA